MLQVLGLQQSAASARHLVTRHSLQKLEPTDEAPHILVVEDNSVNQQIAKRLLEKNGFRVTVVDNGRKAIERVEAGGLDLVLMDVQMPEMDGLEATAIIRQNEAGRGTHIPIVAMTAHAMSGDAERCLAAGMDEYAAKPLEIAKVLQIIEKLTFRKAKSNGQPASTAKMPQEADGLKDPQRI